MGNGQVNECLERWHKIVPSKYGKARFDQDGLCKEYRKWYENEFKLNRLSTTRKNTKFELKHTYYDFIEMKMSDIQREIRIECMLHVLRIYNHQGVWNVLDIHYEDTNRICEWKKYKNFPVEKIVKCVF